MLGSHAKPATVRNVETPGAEGLSPSTQQAAKPQLSFTPSLCGRLGRGQLAGDLFFLLVAGLGLEFLRLGHFLLRFFAATCLQVCLAKLVTHVGAVGLKLDGPLEVGNGLLRLGLVHIRLAQTAEGEQHLGV
jgi:hypothetical protein